jgi:glycosyltransferase involved in cell wall biosynthesis
MFSNPHALARICAAHERIGAQTWIVHNVFPVASAGVNAEARRLRVPVIQFVHNYRPFSVNSYAWLGAPLPLRDWRMNFLREIAAGSWQGSRLKTAWLAAVLTWLHMGGNLRAVKAWVAVSEFMQREFIATGVPAEDVFALRHSWKPMPQPFSEAEGDFYLFLGRLIEAKGVKVLVPAWDQLAASADTLPPKLVICGDGPLAGFVREAAARNRLIEYRGSVSGEAKRNVLATCRGLLAPSVWNEPLGLVVYEAFDFAKPVLAARSGGLPEMVEHGVSGLLHAPGDAAQLAEQVRELDKDTARRGQFGQAGRAWLLANTREDDWKRCFMEIVDHALKRGVRT